MAKKTPTEQNFLFGENVALTEVKEQPLSIKKVVVKEVEVVEPIDGDYVSNNDFVEVKGSESMSVDQLVVSYLAHYRKVGFPYIKLTDGEKIDEFDRLKNLDTKPLVHDKTVESESSASVLVNSYHPHRYEVICGDKITARDVFRRDDLLKRCIRKILTGMDARKTTTTVKVSDSKLRSMLSIFSGVQTASNFPCGTAKAVYEHFLKDTSGVVWDPSSGFGGRLLAALSTRSVTRYQGTDPSTKSYAGYNAMLDDLKRIGVIKEEETDVSIANTGSEVDLPSDFTEVDLCFTSPPYFNTERYAREPTQSFARYTTQSEWMNKFMHKTLENCLKLLKPDGVVAINIANVSTYTFLEQHTVREAERVGFKLVDTLTIPFSVMPGKGARNKSAENVGGRVEPIFIFKVK